MNDEHEGRSYSDEREEINEKMEALARRGAVLAARELMSTVNPHLAVPVDLRGFLAGLVSAQASAHPLAIMDDDARGEAVGKILNDMEPVIARMELEAAAADDDPFRDLPVYDAPKGDDAECPTI